MMASLALTAMLAIQAWLALSAQRMTMERLLHDYATIAAREFVRRTTSEVGYYGFYVLMNALGKDCSALPTAADLKAAADERVARASTLVLETFCLPRYPDVTAPAWLARVTAQQTSESKPPFLVMETGSSGSNRMLVVRRLPEGAVIGLVIDRRALPIWIEAGVRRQPLLPGGLATGDLESALSLELVDAGGNVFFHRGGPLAGAAVNLPFDSDYGGLFAGARVKASLNPTLAGRLAGMGAPASAQLTVALWLTAAALTLLALAQLRRERSLSRMREDFISGISHDLRTPLAKIRLYAETLRLGRSRSVHERLHALEVIERECLRLATLVDNMLQFARLRRADPEVRTEPRQLDRLVAEIVDEFRPMTTTPLDVRLAPVTARVDTDALRRILFNLLENAVKYAGDGTVRITVGPLDGEAEVTVEDDGPGIPAAEREVVWRPYYRGRRERHGAAGGAGIGLAVVDDLVRAHGARLQIEESSGGGTRVVIRFAWREKK